MTEHGWQAHTYSANRHDARHDLLVNTLPKETQQHLLHFMRTECKCEEVPCKLVQTRSMLITITGADTKVEGLGVFGLLLWQKTGVIGLPHPGPVQAACLARSPRRAMV